MGFGIDDGIDIDGCSSEMSVTIETDYCTTSSLDCCLGSVYTTVKKAFRCPSLCLSATCFESHTNDESDS